MYNNSTYNEAEYNETWLYLDATEIISNTDLRNELIEQVNTEVTIIIDSLSKYLNNNPYLDDVLLSDDDIKNMLIKALNENTSLTDAYKSSILKSLSELLTLSEIRSILLTRQFVESMVLISRVTKSITDKMFKDSIRLQSWLSVKKSGSHWSN